MSANSGVKFLGASEGRAGRGGVVVSLLPLPSHSASPLPSLSPAHVRLMSKNFLEALPAAFKRRRTASVGGFGRAPSTRGDKDKDRDREEAPAVRLVDVDRALLALIERLNWHRALSLSSSR